MHHLLQTVARFGSCGSVLAFLALSGRLPATPNRAVRFLPAAPVTVGLAVNRSVPVQEQAIGCFSAFGARQSCQRYSRKEAKA